LPATTPTLRLLTGRQNRSASWEHLVTEMRDALTMRLSDGRMKFKTHVAEGLDNLPATFYGMFTNESFGKTVVKV
jgi:NADPH-dependent curcumin reductase CurA